MAALRLSLLCCLSLVLGPAAAANTTLAKREWAASVLRRFEAVAADEFARAAAVLERMTDRGTVERPARARTWNLDGPDRRTFEMLPRGGVPVDSPLCAVEMGDTSRHMSVRRFKASSFLAVFKLPEQLSKARLHMSEVIFVAKKTGRVLILPRVGHSNIAMYQTFPYCTYFDAKKVGKQVDWVTYEFYVRSMLRLGIVPKVHYLCMRRTHNLCEMEYYTSNVHRGLPLMALTHGVAPNASNTLTLFRPSVGERLSEGAIRTDELLERVNSIEANLLIFEKNTWEGAVDGSFETHLDDVQFSLALIDLAKVAKEDFGGRLVGVHLRWEWTTFSIVEETLRDQRLTFCCESIKKSLMSAYVNVPDPAFYIASDISPATFQVYTYSFASPNVAIACMKDIVKEHHPLTLGHFRGFSNYTLEPLEAIDNGLQGILDKLICAAAQDFYSASGYCGGGHSFEREILYYRELFGQKTESHHTFQSPVELELP